MRCVLDDDAREELDKLVGRKVMRWTLGNWPGVYGCWLSNGLIVAHDTQWHPSEDIEAAWLVVELMVARMEDESGFDWQGPIYKSTHTYMDEYPIGTTCWFVRLVRNGLIEYICAETPMLAICRAALRAVGA